MTAATWTLRCSACDTAADRDRASVCSACGQPLFAHYDLAAAGRTLTKESLRSREKSLWRYREVLPVRDAAGRLIAVFDVDSDQPAAFNAVDQTGLEAILTMVFAAD